ncbi:carcinoembryonic antigen-related cell adhesion molecule 1-like isoform X1 [Puntigrus tetrazona]|uniref:carcinoembryonic antigen-related cell adhesion molecule 1-like isoform X1 n=1 Tax=Puntigrus tetrazona TaxID=1606681 RepID=UPI001C892090|nr:carcinoembryonic antigen-related cell adhesion molecule 1-like isoform X1 [Puntigrus tetrazona]
MKDYDFPAVCLFLLYAVSSVCAEVVSVEGDPVTLKTDVTLIPQQRIKWYFNHTLIAQITGGQSSVCTDAECLERFRGRLKVDNQTGSLTITNTRTTDSGLYRLVLFSSTDKIFSVTVTGTSDADGDVSVMEGDSVTLHTDVKINQSDRIRWFYVNTRIAQIIGGKSSVCTGECPERFRDRLTLDNQTGSLTFTNINITHAGQYKLQIIISSSGSGSVINKIFSVTVYGVSAVKQGQMKRKSVKEGESVTLDPGLGRKGDDLMMWYFKDILLIEATGDQSQVCSDDECKERFRDRLELDHQTGSLTIMNIKTTDSGEYLLKISRFSSHRLSITSEKIFNVSVTDSGLSSGAVAGIVVSVLLVVVAAAVVLLRFNQDQ